MPSDALAVADADGEPASSRPESRAEDVAPPEPPKTAAMKAGQPRKACEAPEGSGQEAPNLEDSLRLAEAFLFASADPVRTSALARLLPGAALPELLEALGKRYEGRGVELVRVGDAWAFRTAADLAGRLAIERKRRRKLSRAALETLAIVAYHQPVTRAEIEEIRGVTVSPGTLDLLFEEGWIEPKGQKQVPGRPSIWRTTNAFLDHFGLESRKDLPGLRDLQRAGLLSRGPSLGLSGAGGEAGEG